MPTTPKKVNDESPVLVNDDGQILTITFNRPADMNAVNSRMAARLREVAEEIAGSRSRVILLRGNGAVFMAGGDVSAMVEAEDLIAMLGQIIDDVHAFSLALARVRQPVVAAVHGAAAGYGLSLMIACDVSLAASSAKLNFAYRGLGTSPDGAATYWLNRLVGPLRATELLLLRDRIDAADAQKLGLVTEVASDLEFDVRLTAILNRLLANAESAACQTKRMLRGDLRAYELALQAERDAFLCCASQPDFKEGIRAFVDKRKPAFGSVTGDKR